MTIKMQEIETDSLTYVIQTHIVNYNFKQVTLPLSSKHLYQTII